MNKLIIFFTVMAFSFSLCAKAPSDSDVNTFEGYTFVLCDKCINLEDFQRAAFRKTSGNVIVVNLENREAYTFSVSFENGQQSSSLIDNPEGTNSAIEMAYQLSLTLEDLNEDIQN